MKYLFSFLLAGISIGMLAQKRDSIQGVIPLGEITIKALKKANQLTQTQVQEFHKSNLTDAASLIPSVLFSKTGSRNETFVSIRGFNYRSIPVFMDGIPIYIPYDGSIDLKRFTTFDLQSIRIDKGFTPMEYGANTLGGSINLISKTPQNKFEGFAQSGIGSGRKWYNGIALGGRSNSWYWMGNFHHTQQEFIILSNRLHTNTIRQKNSYENDLKWRLKLGYTPNNTDEYSFNYSYQSAKKGNPTYTGDDERIRIRYWQWPHWDKQSIYVLSNTRLSNKTQIKLRIYYDTFKNQLESYDDDSYSTQTRGYAFSSQYDDFTLGTNAVFKYRANKQTIHVSGHFKQDHHRSTDNDNPTISFIDNSISFGVDYTYDFSHKNSLVTGLSYHNRINSKAEEFNKNLDEIVMLPTSKDEAFNMQIAFRHKVNKNQNFQFSIAQKSRFATMKDRYSYRFGNSIPNPDLKSEKAVHVETTYRIHSENGIQFETSLYHSTLYEAIAFVYLENLEVRQIQNTGKAHFYGLEFSLQIPITRNGKWHTQYSFIKQKNLTNPNIFFTDVPQHHVGSYFQYSIGKHFKTSLHANYFSERYSTSYGTKAKAFTKFDLNLQYRWNAFTLQAHITNLTDANYAFSEGYPDAGRSFDIELNYKF